VFSWFSCPLFYGRPSANFVLSTVVPLCIAGMQKKKKKKKKDIFKMKLTFRLIRAHVAVFRDYVRECSTIISIQ
jgi:hypothetical protein